MPSFDAWREVTDSSLSHTLQGTNFNPETSQMVRVGDYLYFAYATSTTALWIRRFPISTMTGEAPVQVDSAVFSSSYHYRYSIMRDGDGAIHLINVADYTAVTYTNANTLSSGRYRRIPDLARPATWTAAGGLLYSRIVNSSANFTAANPIISDVTAVYDDSSGTSYVVLEGTNFTPMESRSDVGAPRIFYRMGRSGGDGPYTLIECGAKSSPLGAGYDPSTTLPHVVYAKGDLAISYEGPSTKTLHVIWLYQNEYYYDDPGPPATLRTRCSNVYYARSADGGATWSPMDGSCVVSLTGTLGSEHAHISANDSRFMIYTGDVDQNSARAIAVDANGRPAVALVTPKSGQSSKMILGYIDWEQSPTCDLKFIRWNGSAWVTSTIDSSADYKNYRPKLFFAADGTLYLFAGTGTSSVRYMSSNNSGENWSAWKTIASGINENYRLQLYPDPEQPEFVYLTTADSSTAKMYFMRARLTDSTAAARSSPYGFRNRFRPSKGPKSFRGQVGKSTGRVASFKSED